MGATLKYGEFKFASGGSVDMKQDKATVKAAVHKHEKGMHPGEPLTKLKKGGVVPSRETVAKRATKETPTMQREEVSSRSKVVVPARRGVPVAPTEPLVGLKRGGCACKK